MIYLIDSNIVAEYLKGRPQSVEFLATRRGDELAVSIITLGEIYEGIYFGRDRRQNERGFAQFLRRARVFPLTTTIMKRFARVRGNLRARGLLIPDPDLLIAATALYHDATLVTRNVRDFGRVPGLPIETPP